MLYTVVGEPAAGKQVGVHAGDGWVWGDHYLHDGLCFFFSSVVTCGKTHCEKLDCGVFIGV